MIKRQIILRVRTTECLYFDKHVCNLWGKLLNYNSPGTIYHINTKSGSYRVRFHIKTVIHIAKNRYSQINKDTADIIFEPEMNNDILRFQTKLIKHPVEGSYEIEIPNAYLYTKQITIKSYVTRANKGQEMELYNQIRQKITRDELKQLQCEAAKMQESIKLQEILTHGFYIDFKGNKGDFYIQNQDKILKIKCKKLVAELRHTQNCYQDTPVKIGNRNGYLNQISKIFLLDSIQIDCNRRSKRASASFFEMFEITNLAGTIVKSITRLIFFQDKSKAHIDFSKIFSAKSLSRLDRSLSKNEVGKLYFLQDIVKSKGILILIVYIAISAASITAVIVAARKYGIPWVKTFSLVAKPIKVAYDLKKYKKEQQRADQIKGEIAKSSNRDRQKLKKLQLQTLMEIKDEKEIELKCKKQELNELENLEKNMTPQIETLV